MLNHVILGYYKLSGSYVFLLYFIAKSCYSVEQITSWSIGKTMNEDSIGHKRHYMIKNFYLKSEDKFWRRNYSYI